MDNSLLRQLPGIDSVLGELKKQGVPSSPGVKRLVRFIVEELRTEISQDSSEKLLWKGAEDIFQEVILRCQGLLTPRLQKVVNATGIILHTNLGRAPIPPAGIKNLRWIGSGYCNLEYDLSTGKRGSRQDICGFLLSLLTGAEKALIVNNNAAAVLLVLDTLARGGEAIISRGELVEIGGSFRIPEVMSKGGVSLREVGTTNRTRLEDYEEAIGEDTKLLIKVHPSNYRITGFTEEGGVEDLGSLAQKHNLISYYDLGSGSLWPLPGEPSLNEITSGKLDLVSFSGDKLLGGAQAGIILGRKDLIDKMARNNLLRALRIDKLSLAALEATLRQYLLYQPDFIPTYKMFQMTEKELLERTEDIHTYLEEKIPSNFKMSIGEGTSFSGGGTLPQEAIPGPVLHLRGKNLELSQFHQKLREAEIPIIASVFKGKIEFNLRTVSPEEEDILKTELARIAQEVKESE